MPGKRRGTLVMLAFVALAGCGNKGPAPPDVSQTLLEAGRDNAVITLATVFPGNWERVVIVPPYTSENESRRIVGADWMGYETAEIATRGNITLLVFLDANKSVITGGIVKRHIIDFNPVYRMGGYSRGDAKFRIVERVAVWVPAD
ncbi:hypothetical protein F183_A48110 [Bryobacterales bacterium F-183]|nr:hypothetical protein F183_A48110 [Bryobacterales bacterium F-183]